MHFAEANMPTSTDNLDDTIWGAEQIAEAANLYKRDKKTGEKKPDVRKAFYLLETGAIAAKRVIGRDKDGQAKTRGQWVSTLRLIRNSLLPETI
jgi:hypothetical protein